MSTFTSMTDQKLVQAYLDGNNHAFDELLARNQDNIFGYIIKVVEDEELANELLDDMDFDRYGKVKCRKIEGLVPRLMKMVESEMEGMRK